MKHTQAESIRGFSLIEMMVSLTVFSIVMTISVGTLLIMVDANAKAQALYSSTTNLSFALDSMTREMRMGYGYNCQNGMGSSLPTGTNSTCPNADSIAFTREKDGIRMGYRLSGNSIEQKIGTGLWTTITSDDVDVDEFDIDVDNSTSLPSDDEQPVVTLHIKGTVNNGLDTATDFNIQTRIVQHGLDIF